MDPVGPIDVGKSGPPEEGTGAGRDSHKGVAGRLGVVISLGFDDHAGTVAAAQHAPHEISCHLDHRPVVERVLHAASASRARASCSLTLARLVPPSDTFDSSQAEPRSTS